MKNKEDFEGKYICNVCGGENIDRLAWIDINHKPLNENHITKWEDDDGTHQNSWCRDCVDNVVIIYKKER